MDISSSLTASFEKDLAAKLDRMTAHYHGFDASERLIASLQAESLLLMDRILKSKTTLSALKGIFKTTDAKRTFYFLIKVNKDIRASFEKISGIIYLLSERQYHDQEDVSHETYEYLKHAAMFATEDIGIILIKKLYDTLKSKKKRRSSVKRKVK